MRLSSKWLAATAAVLLVPAVLVGTGANAAGKNDPCLNTISGFTEFVTESIGGFTYNDAGTPVLEEPTTYNVTWDRSGFTAQIFLSSGCTAAEAGNYRMTVAYPDGRTVSSTPILVTNDPTGAATSVTFNFAHLETVNDSTGKVESRGFDENRLFAYVETFGDRGMVVDRGPDSGANEFCVTSQSTDPTGPCYHHGGGGSGFWN